MSNVTSTIINGATPWGDIDAMRVVLIESDEVEDSRTIGFLESLDPLQLRIFSQLAEALEFLRLYQADVIITDLTLPDSPSEETIRRILSTYMPQPTLMVLTGIEDDRLPEEAKMADGVLSRSALTRAEFVVAMRQASRRRVSRATISMLKRIDMRLGALLGTVIE